jgi:glycosyltransferase involved in cell wall biosynthesis
MTRQANSFLVLFFKKGQFSFYFLQLAPIIRGLYTARDLDGWLELMKRTAIRVAHGAWRLLPADLRRDAMAGVAATLTRKPERVPPAVSHGVIVAGDVGGANGLAETARILHETAAQYGLARGLVPLGLPSVVPVNREPLAPDAALLAVVNAPILPVGLLRLPRGVLKHRRVIGMWAWELPVVPKHWAHGAKFAHEIWACSQFTADAVEPLAPGRVRVVPYPLAANFLPVAGDRASFGLPADKTVVLTVFNLASSMVRKNPLGAIATFKAAFGDSNDHLFVLKLSSVERYLGDVALIRAAIGEAKNIRLMTETLPEPELRGLIAASDIVLSLHRSEGFGLIPAVAMLLGRAVIATGWSGNLDFMTGECSRLVASRLIPAIDPRGTYQLPNAIWAEPDLDDSVAALRRLGGDAGLRARMGQAARAYAAEKLGAAPFLAALAANGIVC